MAGIDDEVSQFIRDGLGDEALQEIGPLLAKGGITTLDDLRAADLATLRGLGILYGDCSFILKMLPKKSVRKPPAPRQQQSPPAAPQPQQAVQPAKRDETVPAQNGDDPAKQEPVEHQQRQAPATPDAHESSRSQDENEKSPRRETGNGGGNETANSDSDPTEPSDEDQKPPVSAPPENNADNVPDKQPQDDEQLVASSTTTITITTQKPTNKASSTSPTKATEKGRKEKGFVKVKGRSSSSPGKAQTFSADNLRSSGKGSRITLALTEHDKEKEQDKKPPSKRGSARRLSLSFKRSQSNTLTRQHSKGKSMEEGQIRALMDLEQDNSGDRDKINNKGKRLSESLRLKTVLSPRYDNYEDRIKSGLDKKEAKKLAKQKEKEEKKQRKRKNSKGEKDNNSSSNGNDRGNIGNGTEIGEEEQQEETCQQIERARSASLSSPSPSPNSSPSHARRASVSAGGFHHSSPSNDEISQLNDDEEKRARRRSMLAKVGSNANNAALLGNLSRKGSRSTIGGQASLTARRESSADRDFEEKDALQADTNNSNNDNEDGKQKGGSGKKKGGSGKGKNKKKKNSKRKRGEWSQDDWLPENVGADTLKKVVKCQAIARRYFVKLAMPQLRVAHELLTTEQNYTHSLQVVVKVFLDPICERKQGPIIRMEQIHRIFSNISQLWEKHRSFLTLLQARLADFRTFLILGVSDLFVKPAFLELYPTYVNNYDDAMEELNKCKKTNAEFAEYLKKCEAKPECNYQNLESFLIMPVQRIPQYSMLLRDLLRKYKEISPQYADLRFVSEKMTESLKDINEQKRHAENIAHADFILSSKCIVDKSYKEFVERSKKKRRFLKEGKIYKNKKTKGEGMYMAVFSDIVVMGKPELSPEYLKSKKKRTPEPSDYVYEIKEIVPIKDISLVSLAKPNDKDCKSFKFQSNKKKFEIFTDTSEQSREWVQMMSAALLEMQSEQQKKMMFKSLKERGRLPSIKNLKLPPKLELEVMQSMSSPASTSTTTLTPRSASSGASTSIPALSPRGNSPRSVPGVSPRAVGGNSSGSPRKPTSPRPAATSSSPKGANPSPAEVLRQQQQQQQARKEEEDEDDDSGLYG